MNAKFRVSLGLNLVLIGGLVWIEAHPEKAKSHPVSVSGGAPAQTAGRPRPTAPEGRPESFRWRQLESTNDYRVYVENLRAIGCPDPTLRDIVQGDVERVFSWKRRQLGLDDSASGPWSPEKARQLAASLLGMGPAEMQTAAAESAPSSPSGNDSGPPMAVTDAAADGAATGTTSPLFLQDSDWTALGFNPVQQAAIAQVRQQFLSQVNGQDQNSGNPTDGNSANADPVKRWHTALQLADQQLRDELGAQGYMAYEQQQYLKWFAPQAQQAGADGGSLVIDPDAFSLQ